MSFVCKITKKMFKIINILVILTLGYSHGLPDQEKQNILAAMVPHIQECSKEHGVTEEEIKTAKGKGNLVDLHGCLMGCIYKKIHVIDDKGFFDLEKSAELYKKYFSGENDQKMISEQINTCAKVNKETVSDGETGCERGRLLNECLMPFQKEFFAMP